MYRSDYKYNFLDYLFENRGIFLLLVLHLVSNLFLIPVTMVLFNKHPWFLAADLVSNISLYVIVIYYYFKVKKRRTQ